MVSKKVVTISVVGALGGLAFIFGVAGFFTSVQDTSTTFIYATDLSYCQWPTAPAAPLGIVGCFLLLVAQIVSNVRGGCVCCCAKQPSIHSGARTAAILCLIISWIFTALASIFLFLGGVYNSGSVHYKLDVYSDGSTACYYPSKWPLIVGAVFSLIATLVTIIFYNIADQAPTDHTNVVQIQTINIGATGFPVDNYRPAVPAPY